MIIEQKQDVVDNSAYFSIFFSDAISAAPPATVDESGRYDASHRIGQRFFIPRYAALCLTRWYSMLGKSYPQALNSIKFLGPN